MQYGLIKTPQQYFMVTNTGRLDSAFEGDMAELLNIKKENENLMTGAHVVAVAWDAHKAHILEHRGVMADPDLRQSEEVKKAVSDHIQEHIDLLRIIDPDVLMLLGETPLTPMDTLLGTGQPQPMAAISQNPEELNQSPQPQNGGSAPESAGQSYNAGQVPPMPKITGPLGGMGTPQ